MSDNYDIARKAMSQLKDSAVDKIQDALLAVLTPIVKGVIVSAATPGGLFHTPAKKNKKEGKGLKEDIAALVMKEMAGKMEELVREVLMKTITGKSGKGRKPMTKKDIMKINDIIEVHGAGFFDSIGDAFSDAGNFIADNTVKGATAYADAVGVTGKDNVGSAFLKGFMGPIKGAQSAVKAIGKEFGQDNLKLSDAAMLAGSASAQPEILAAAPILKAVGMGNNMPRAAIEFN